MKNTPLIVSARVITFVCGLALIVVLFVPLWQIQLNAPQYPEGLVLKMYPDRIAGNVDIINGLNHYIGMKTLHTEDFMEFTVLPYIIVFFAAGCLLVAFLNKRKWLSILTVLFIIFGIVAMVDFYRWEYNYGHDLSPDAAIQIPGMAYQPPLIGYKKLLNFGAYSIPDIGGWIFVAVGISLLTILILQFRKKNASDPPLATRMSTVISAMLLFTLISCNPAPQPIKLGKDACTSCKMTIADSRYGAEIITLKGKNFKFDDTHCLLSFLKVNTIDSKDIKNTYLVNFAEPHDFIEASKAFLLKSSELHSPMGGNIAGFSGKAPLMEAAQKFKGEETSWKELLKEE